MIDRKVIIKVRKFYKTIRVFYAFCGGILLFIGSLNHLIYGNDISILYATWIVVLFLAALEK